MEFDFNVNIILPEKINVVIDRSTPFRYVRAMEKVLDDVGRASARAQQLCQPVTSAEKLRGTDNRIYLLVDAEGNNGMGTVLGLLKVGWKRLYMLDENGEAHDVNAKCLLDFYVHESQQRMGHGKMLYDYMLKNEQLKPLKVPIDSPSDKLLAFMRKHYGLTEALPQSNNYVVFRGFFADVADNKDEKKGRCSLSSRCGTNNGLSNNNNHTEMEKANSSPNRKPYTEIPRNSVGRYAAARPPCSIASIIHNTAEIRAESAERTGEHEHNGVAATPTSASAARLERPRSLSLYSEEEQKQRTNELSTVPTPAAVPEQKSAAPFVVPVAVDRPLTPASSSVERTSERTAEKTTEKTTERTAEQSVKNPSPSCAQEVTGSNQHTHLDLKFYHSRLW